jgi:hypothetical protein
VEQDLVISRALVEIFSNPLLRDALAFRGGTALYKLHLKPAARYSEDIDLVQTKAEANASRIVTVFLHYMDHGGHKITRALFEQNLAEKMGDPEFLADFSAPLSDGYTWDPAAEAPPVSRRLIELLPGDPWKRGA